MKQKLIVLRSVNPTARDMFRGFGAAAAGRAAESARTIVEIEEVDRPAMSRIIGHSEVVAVAPAMPMRLIAPVSDALQAADDEAELTWGVRAVRAQTSSFTGDGVVVAVLDTGIDPAHPAFAGVELVQRNFTSEGPDDQHGHGTHCAGTIFGRKVGQTRIGVAPGVRRALIGKVLGKQGGSSDAIASAVQWAADNGANVISMSLGIDFPGAVKRMVHEGGLPEELATSRALEAYRANVQLFEGLARMLKVKSPWTQPAVIVAAAGNESRRDENPDFEISVSPPAVAEGIVSVAALGRNGQSYVTAPFSNTGANVSGPGVAVVSARRGGGLVGMSGTSMATPHVAGVAALWAEKLMSVQSLSALQLTAHLLGSASREGLRAGFDPLDIGAGMVTAPQS